MSRLEQMVVSFLRGLIWLYRHSLSALLGRECRFLPTCSAYADEALRVHGALRGSALAAKRLCRCHPWGGSGYDPVPEETESLEPIHDLVSTSKRRRHSGASRNPDLPSA